MTNTILLIRRPEVERRTGLTRPTIYRRIKAGLFPPPIDIGGNRKAWLDSEINAHNEARITGKSDEAIKGLIKQLVLARKALRGGEND